MSFNILTNPFSPLRHVYPMAAGRIAMFNGGSSDQTSTVTQTVPEESRPYLYGDRGILPRAQALSEQPLNLPDYQVAGFTQPQQQAFNLAQSGIGGYMPALSQGFGAMQGGVGAVSQAMGMIPSALTASNQSFGRASSGTQQALNQANPLFSSAAQGTQQTLNQANPLFSYAAQGTQGALAGATPYQLGSAMTGLGASQGYDPSTAYRGYMNPYLEDVVRQSEQDIARQGDIQAKGIRSQAAGQGAFGGSRQAIAERELGRNVAEQQARTSSGLRAEGFGQAQQQAQQSFEQQQQRQGQYAQLLGNLGTSYGQLGLQGAGQLADIGSARGQLGLQGAGQLADIGAARGQLGLQGAGQFADIGAAQGQLGIQGAGQLGSLGLGLGSLGTQMGQMGELAQSLNIRDVGTLMDIGTAQQAQAQAGLDAQRQNEYQRTMSPYQQLGFYSDIYQGLPVGQTQTTTQPGPNALSQLAGLATGIYGLTRPYGYR